MPTSNSTSSADTLEEQLFRPVQAAYGRAKRTHADFAARYELLGQVRAGVARASVDRSEGVLEVTVDSLERAENILVELQDSMSPVEVGDAELRAGLAEMRHPGRPV
jgi:hypothetical protein